MLTYVIVLVQKGLIQEDGMEIIPEDSSVLLRCPRAFGITQKYFTYDGWLAVANVVEALRKYPIYYRNQCTSPSMIRKIPFSVTAAWCCFTSSTYANLKQAPKQFSIVHASCMCVHR